MEGSILPDAESVLKRARSNEEKIEEISVNHCYRKVAQYLTEHQDELSTGVAITSKEVPMLTHMDTSQQREIFGRIASTKGYGVEVLFTIGWEVVPDYVWNWEVLPQLADLSNVNVYVGI